MILAKPMPLAEANCFTFIINNIRIAHRTAFVGKREVWNVLPAPVDIFSPGLSKEIYHNTQKRQEGP